MIPAMEHCLKTISFLVNVPVLSEKMNFTWPSSSFKFEVRAFAGVSVSSSYISLSYEQEESPMHSPTQRSKSYRANEIRLNEFDEINGYLQRDRNEVVEQNEERQKRVANPSVGCIQA